MSSEQPILYILAGLPGSGKTTISQRLAKQLNITHLRIDTIEQGLRDLCDVKVTGEGYRLTYRIAQDNLKLGLSVIADSCNPIQLSRNEWEQVAIGSGARYVNIEFICSDQDEHKKRVETRDATIPGQVLPTWEKVVNREYDKWDRERIVIDTAFKSIDECMDELIGKVEAYTELSVI